MEIYFQVITDAETLKEACETLKQFDVLGFDTETTVLIRIMALSDSFN